MGANEHGRRTSPDRTPHHRTLTKMAKKKKTGRRRVAPAAARTKRVKYYVLVDASNRRVTGVEHASEDDALAEADHVRSSAQHDVGELWVTES